MYTSYIGLKFLNSYNQKRNTAHTAATFFDQVMFPLFFDDERHLMHVANSPFFQTPSSKELAERGIPKAHLQYEKMRQKIAVAASSGAVEVPDASIYVGFAANGPDQTTAGQVTSMRIAIDAEEMYASWIGNALAARVEGSQCLLFDSEAVLWHIFQGWEVYRNYLKTIAGMDGRQIETWNGYWLAHGYLERPVQPAVKGSKLETTPWLQVIVRLLDWHAGAILPVYVFSLGQTNTTFGFINIHLPDMVKLSEARRQLEASIFQSEDETEDLFWYKYQPEFSLRELCQLGEIGLRGLRPQDYGKLMESPFSKLKITDKNRHLFFNIQIWLTAMLNNKQELQQLAAELAQAMIATEAKGTGKERGKNTDAVLTKALFDAKGYTSFANALSDLVAVHKDAKETFKSVLTQCLALPSDQFPLFKALTRFEYNYIKA